MFPKIGVPPNHQFYWGFSLIFTIHFGVHPQKLTWNLEMMVSNRNLRTSKGPPFSGEPCLFWGVYHYFWSAIHVSLPRVYLFLSLQQAPKTKTHRGQRPWKRSSSDQQKVHFWNPSGRVKIDTPCKMGFSTGYKWSYFNYFGPLYPL